MEAMCCLLRQVVVPAPSTDSTVWTWHSVWGGSLVRIMLWRTKRGWANLLHMNALLLVLAKLPFSFRDNLRGLYLVLETQKHENCLEGFVMWNQEMDTDSIDEEIVIRNKQSLGLWKLHPHHGLQSAIPLLLKSQMMIIVLLRSLSWSHQLKMMTLLWSHSIHRMILTIGKMRSQEISGLTDGLLHHHW